MRRQDLRKTLFSSLCVIQLDWCLYCVGGGGLEGVGVWRLSCRKFPVTEAVMGVHLEASHSKYLRPFFMNAFIV